MNSNQVSFDKIVKFVLNSIPDSKIEFSEELNENEKMVLIKMKKLLNEKIKTEVSSGILLTFIESGITLDQIENNGKITEEEKQKLIEIWKLLYTNEPSPLIKDEKQFTPKM